MAGGVAKENEDPRAVRSLEKQRELWRRVRKPHVSGIYLFAIFCVKYD